MKRNVARQIDRLAMNRHGVVTRSELLGFGLTLGQLRHELRSGSLLRLRRGVYRLNGAPSTWEQTVMAACLATGGVASHYTACRLHGSTVVEYDQLTLSVTRGHRRVEGVELHRTAALAEEDMHHRGRIPTTSPLRTLEDMAPILDRSTLLELATDFVNRRVLTLPQLREAVSQLHDRHPRGETALRQVVLSLLGDSPYDSVAEARLHEVLLRAGLPDPRRQFQVVDLDGHHVGRLDFAWPDALLNLEMDGYGPHSSPEAFRANRRRDMRLAALGWTVLRTTPADLEDGTEQLVTTIRHLLEGPGAPGGKRHERRKSGDRVSGLSSIPGPSRSNVGWTQGSPARRVEPADNLGKLGDQRRIPLKGAESDDSEHGRVAKGGRPRRDRRRRGAADADVQGGSLHE